MAYRGGGVWESKEVDVCALLMLPNHFTVVFTLEGIL